MRQTERNVDSNGVAYSLRTVSLLVKPGQAETITLATGLGELYMTLRRPDDDLEAESEGMTIQELFGNEPPTSVLAQSTSPNGAGTNSGQERQGFVQWLAQSTAQLAAASAPAAAVESAPPAEKAAAQPPAWTMQILTQDGCREFRWNSMNGLPDEVLQDTSEAPAPPVSRQAVVPAPSDAPGGMQTEELRSDTETPISRTAT